MLPEISLNVLDITQNSISAEADFIEIIISINSVEHTLKATIKDNGRGMDEETVKTVIDPFYTTRTTRKVGLGVPFFKQAAECTGGFLELESEVGKGTMISATFHTDNIDCMPLGDINSTVYSLITFNPQIDFYYEYSVDEHLFDLDTRQMRELLGGVSLDAPEVASFIREYLIENEADVNSKAGYSI